MNINNSQLLRITSLLFFFTAGMNYLLAFFVTESRMNYIAFGSVSLIMGFLFSRFGLFKNLK